MEYSALDMKWPFEELLLVLVSWITVLWAEDHCPVHGISPPIFYKKNVEIPISFENHCDDIAENLTIIACNSNSQLSVFCTV